MLIHLNLYFFNYLVNNYKLKVLIGAIYRPPNTELSSYNIEFKNILKPRSGRGVKCILAGMSVLPMIKRPMRYGKNCTALIDNILSNKLYDNNLSGIILDDLSDHLPILFLSQVI